ncbi:hypothetical protein E6P09_13980 [Haloferax mediterranei ATCC 33500]|uniref:Uncharacterized protein n=1 Tax=Haloferax mediterranei (strain ATCC 33500 / DSM 1411 / JCM 8866 / NBRC 14739 / NCIMB 2177 / R-4) TaxID=523841 RepID=I3R7N1_HALMT|nr:hypothetical protein [Haloferax mediterranei]AFK20241.1 hypothetical protein HFX_2560 [Haloferax mediterranei ATCC 33500]AHZ23611.1 hypothetical protein BM92_13605 [Haloferax mediterranei ATCC 33500]ELZ99096.1 hypothetical protein C439_14594 [Haloferax mediterranei ATCC 33500]MDX5987007.1 hypothetical protein [Haloferax mediterranei ATCC 33500]QCQ76324.1 hypothetical protein E6P09_13980 [Haloferax mediterranei ATCC 33500]
MSATHRLVSLFLVVLLVSAPGTVLAQESETPSDEEMQELLEEGVALYNENIDQLDVSFARDLIAGKTVNVYVEDGDETHVFSAVVKDDMRIADVAAESNEDASTRIETDRATLETIAQSSNPVAGVKQALRNDRIRVSGEKGHPVDQAVWTVANLFKGFVL